MRCFDIKDRVYSAESFNILCLGDSYTYGYGSADRENSYPKQLERLIHESIDKDIVVVNKGVPGNTSSLILKKLQEDIVQYKPYIMLIMIGCNNHWNFKDSSYFLLNKKDTAFKRKSPVFLNKLKVYRLVSIVWLNFKHKIADNFNTNFAQRIKNAAKASKTINSSGDHYLIYLESARLYNAKKNSDLAKDSVWKAVYSINEANKWSEDALFKIFSQLGQTEDDKFRYIEITKLKKYIQDNYNGRLKRRLIQLIDAKLNNLEDKNIFRKVLEYDLLQILDLAKKNKIKVVLQTYPHKWVENEIVLEFCNRYYVSLVDNEKIFEENIKQEPAEDFFIEDGHCNGRGYGLIAQNVYNILASNGLIEIPEKKI